MGSVRWEEETGSDLRILKSLDESMAEQSMAVDIEPGLSEFYVGEDLFTALHPYLTSKGFWLSSIQVQGSVRMSPKVLEALEPSDEKRTSLQSSLKTTPGWVEARYLRDVRTLTSKAQYVKLWAFAVLDNQLGYAIDVGMHYRSQFGEDELYTTMESIVQQVLHPSRFQLLKEDVRRRLPTSIKRRIRPLDNRLRKILR